MNTRWLQRALLSCAAVALAVSCSSGDPGAPVGNSVEEVGQSVVAPACMTDQDCPTGTPCLMAVCDPNTHVCKTATTNAACNDGKACTTNDACASGACVGGDAAPGCSPCQAAAVLPPEGGVFTGAVSGTSTLQGSCASSGGSPERVYSWTPARSGLARFSTCGGTTNFDTVVYLLDGACASSAQAACNDDTPGCGTSDGLPNGENHGSLVSVNVVAGHQYFVVVDGWGGRAGSYTLDVTPPFVCGDGVREGAEQCDGADASACSGRPCTATCACSVPPGGLPDLVTSISNVSVQLNATVGAGDVSEGCAATTTGNKLLVFSTTVANRGTADIVLGDPGCPDCATHPLEACANPAFVCSPGGGHNHGHYSNYAFYELLDAQGVLVAAGHKQGFCLRDSSCTSGAPTYDCSNQGISAGCSDVYAAGLGCQYIDIGNVLPGQYTLRVRVDPFNDFVELDENNNAATMLVTIPGTPTPQIIPAAGGTFQGTTSGASTQTGTCASSATASAPEHIFQWTPSTSGTATIQTCGKQGTFDTVLYLRTALTGGTELACNDDKGGCHTGDGSRKAGQHGSVIKPTVTAGQTYYIVVDGHAGSSGGSQGAYIVTVIPPAP